ncbi:MAG: hypothetical protein LBU60_02720 [Clostridiales bacterium]|nr:hypothetical protein [Clostridiales bacterium]
MFKYTDLLNKKFDGVQGLKTLLEYAFIQTTDPKRKLPIEFKTMGQELDCIWTDDTNTIDITAFIDFLFDKYNIYLDFSLDFKTDKIICTITKNETQGLVLKDNIKVSKPEVDSNELPAENKAILYDKDRGTIKQTYYLLTDNTITTNQNHKDRILPPSTKYIEWDEVDAIKEGYTMEQLAMSELSGNIYNHCIKYQLSKKQTMVKPLNFKFGDKITVIYEGRSYDSIFTGIKYKMKDSFYTCIFGKTRIDFTDRMKMYNNRKFEKRQ